ncbi:GNAT family N-acetyltransferase [Macrococcus equipercicus]|uniref:GNAT family N-acetyltransferase n=1 Tax=Macrococcus equipercicus TaxID=69967 RepID=A0ABQ6RAW9_9STAP|nr:GNAT family N-acetyltransferase [Macrococcus equipercicus]KAA1042395.1 GNAT family N-acetyltransferase [Macrococcus equipercicus]
MIYLETDRLQLRDFVPEDLQPFKEMNVDPDVRQYFPDIMSFKRSEMAFRHMQQEIDATGLGLYAVEEKKSRKFIGFIGVQYMEATPMYSLDIMPCYEIGWRLIKSAWGKGYATEGARAVLDYVRPRIDLPIYSFTSIDNKRSMKVMEKLGLKQVTTFKHPLVDPRHPMSLQVLYKDVAQ